MQSMSIRRLARTYGYLGRSLPTYGCACENVRGTYRHADGANMGIRTGVTPETCGWNTGKPTGVRTAVKRKPFHGMYRTSYVVFLCNYLGLPHAYLQSRQQDSS